MFQVLSFKFHERGFSLLETIVALSILVTGIGGAVGLVAQSLSTVSAIKDIIVAANLAQEGIEVVRNLRDENWLNDLDWRGSGGGIALNSDGDYRVQYDSLALISYANVPLQRNAFGYHGYNGEGGFTGGSDTPFKRKISISTVTSTEMKVTSTVEWKARGNDKSLVIEDRLFNWK